jgi:uncharacterized membrane protein
MTKRKSQAAAWSLAGLLSGMGVLHFAAPKPFDAIVPPALPGSARAYTYGSGVAELGVAAALAVPRTRRLGGLAAVALFLGVFPANIQMAADWWRDPKIAKPLKYGALARLPLQIPLVLVALRARRNAG